MKSYKSRFIKLIVGLILYAIGIVLTLRANIGYAPWDVFHAGIAGTTKMTIGMASIVVGLAIFVIVIILGEKLGLGSVLNMILIGLFIDWILAINIIPLSQNFITGFLMLVAGLFIISLASYFYMGSAFGAGPRDSLMVGLKRKTGLSIGFCRGSLEVAAALVGWRMGGLLGLGTIIAAFLMGFCIQITFKALHFDSTEVNHETLIDTYQNIMKNRKDSISKAAK